MEGLLVRFYNGETTADESARIESWINQSADHRKIAEQVSISVLHPMLSRLDSRSMPRSHSNASVRESGPNAGAAASGVWSVSPPYCCCLLFSFRAGCSSISEGEFNTMVEIRSTTGMVSCVTLPTTPASGSTPTPICVIRPASTRSAE